MRHTVLYVLVMLCVGVCVRGESEKPQVYVVNYPLAYFTERIGGDAIDVVFPEIDGDPAFWNPSREWIEAYQRADLILLNGANYAKWVARVSLPTAKTVDTSMSVALLMVDDGPVHNHGPTGAHSHAGTAFTTWLNPQHAIKQVEVIVEALVRLVPAQQPTFERRSAQLKQELELLDEQLEVLFAENSSQLFIASHPVYQYLADRYHLNLQSVTWEADEEITSEQWNALDRLRKKHPATVMIWEGVPLERSTARVEALGMQSITFVPCGNRQGSATFMEVMQQNVEAVRSLSQPVRK